MNTTIRVGVNGYGVIGKRVADAVTLQPDMELVGVADTATDYRLELAGLRGYPHIDAIRALAGAEADAAKSIATTDAALGVRPRLP